jgi:hypothetical protein
MLAGHFAAAFAARRFAPRTSLGTLVVAAELLDLLWPVFVLLGFEHFSIAPAGAVPALVFDHYPWSHSLLAAFWWAMLAGGAYFGLRRDVRGAVVVAALVVSHWFLDLIVHIPDLKLVPGARETYGLGLWTHPAASFLLELALLAAGAALYARATRAVRPAGSWGFWSLVAFIALMLAGAAFGPPPPSTGAVVWTDMAMWLLVAWAWWCDRARTPR